MSPRRFHRGPRVWHAGREPYKNLGVSQTLLFKQVGVSKRKAGTSMEAGNSDRLIVLRGRESRPQVKQNYGISGKGPAISRIPQRNMYRTWGGEMHANLTEGNSNAGKTK